MSVITDAEWNRAADVANAELVDGVVRPRVHPTAAHEQIKARLSEVLETLVMTSMTVVTDVEIRLEDLLRRRPDVAVVRSVGLDPARSRVEPEHVVLAIEVVCPGSETTDRKHKPVEYADADLPHYWRVETMGGLRLHTYRLGENSFYLETGLFREGDLVFDPTLRWASFELNELTESPT